MGTHETLNLSFDVRGMTCASCVGRVERVLRRVPGVDVVTVNLATERAAVTAAPSAVGAALEAVRDAGYEPVTARADLRIVGMTCSSCVARIERRLRAEPGVVSAVVNLASERAAVEHVPRATHTRALRAAIVDAGYEAPEDAEERGTSARAAGNELARRNARDVLVAAAFAAPLLVFTMLPMLFPTLHATFGPVMHFFMGWGSLALAAPVQFWAGRRFYRQGFAELRHRSPGMSTLVMLGSSAAFFYSLAVLLVPDIFPDGTGHTYFEASASVVTLILLGKYLEGLAKGRTSSAIQKLLSLQAKTARVVRGDGTLEIPIDQLVVGDRVAVRPGERVPFGGRSSPR